MLLMEDGAVILELEDSLLCVTVMTAFCQHGACVYSGSK